MKIEKSIVEGKNLTLYKADSNNRPLIVLNNYSGDGISIVKILEEKSETDFNLLNISNLKWDNDMTPWYCPPLSENDTPCTGGANEHLDVMVSKMIPKAIEKVNGTPAFIGIAGYSLAGLFALYSMYKCDVFDRVASMSGSLWFPNFKEYIEAHDLMKVPDRLYLSLGDKEAKTNNPILKTVRENSEYAVDNYKKQGINVTWELNPGNHFKDATIRSAKGILALLK